MGGLKRSRPLQRRSEWAGKGGLTRRKGTLTLPQVRRGSESDRRNALDARALLTLPESERDRGWRKLLPAFENELYRVTTDKIGIALVGWIALAWLRHGHAHLVGTREQLGQLLGCGARVIARHARRLHEAGWIEEFQHFTTHQVGVIQRQLQISNSYRAGAELRRALDGATEE